MDFIQHIRWRPEIGDPSVMGWVTVAAYALAAFTAWLAARGAGHGSGVVSGSRGLWMGVAMLMAFLCINKQIDLQSLFTDIGRVFAKKQGWYEERRQFQKWFVVGVLAASFLVTTLVALRYRAFWKRHFMLAAGLAFLLTFIVVRAVSFHHVDALLKSRVGGMKRNWILEITGITLVWLAALLDCRKPKRSSAAARKVRR